MVTLNNNKLSAMKAVRIALDLSIEEFSNKLGVTSSYISAIENRKKHISMSLMEKMKEVYNIKMSEYMQIQEFLEFLETLELTYLEKYRFMIIKSLGVVDINMKDRCQNLLDNYFSYNNEKYQVRVK